MNMTYKEISRATTCKECGGVKHRGVVKYTCDGCGLPIKKGDGKHQMEMLSFDVHWQDEEFSDGPSDRSRDVHLHNLKCLIAWFRSVPDELLETIDFASFYMHDFESLKAFRDALVKR
jgi:hypothetical protein